MSDQTERPGFMRRVLSGVFGVSRPPAPDPSPRVAVVARPCGCGEDHPTDLAAALFGQRKPVPPSVEVSSREWVVAFADKVTPGSVINIPRSDVDRLALRVLEVREHDVGGEFERAVTFLAVDVADASQPFSPTLSVHQGLRIAVSAPDSPAGLGGAR